MGRRGRTTPRIERRRSTTQWHRSHRSGPALLASCGSPKGTQPWDPTKRDIQVRQVTVVFLSYGRGNSVSRATADWAPYNTRNNHLTPSTSSIPAPGYAPRACSQGWPPHTIHRPTGPRTPSGFAIRSLLLYLEASAPQQGVPAISAPGLAPSAGTHQDPYSPNLRDRRRVPEIGSILPNQAFSPQSKSRFLPTTCTARRTKCPETFVGKLDYSLIPSISFTRPERARGGLFGDAKTEFYGHFAKAWEQNRPAFSQRPHAAG
eukprot:gene3922-biopygen2303